MVFINFCHQPQRVQIANTSGHFARYTTAASENLRRGEPVNSAEGLMLPPESVTTLVAEPPGKF